MGTLQFLILKDIPCKSCVSFAYCHNREAIRDLPTAYSLTAYYLKDHSKTNCIELRAFAFGEELVEVVVEEQVGAIEAQL